MLENNNVFVTPKGKKYHMYSSCVYLKGRKYKEVPFNQAKRGKKGPCSTCKKLYEKKGSKMDNIGNNIFPMIQKDKKLENYSSSKTSESFEEEKNSNSKENNIPFNLDEISRINSNIHNIDSKLDIELSKDKNENENNINNINIKDIINKKINKINNNISSSDNEEEEEEKEDNDNINNNYKIIKTINIKEDKDHEINFNNMNNINNFNKNSLENMKKLKYNLEPNLPKKDLNWTGKDFLIFQETNTSSKLIFLQDITQIPKLQEKNITFVEKPEDKEDTSTKKGNFKFKFEITPYKELKEPIQISVGFEIDYYEEENNIKKENRKMSLNYETLILIKHFYIYKKTNKVHVLINISKGKFFVVGEDELEKRNKKVFLNSENSDILFLKNFPGIKLELIKEVRPLFKLNQNCLKLVNIDV